MNIVEVLFLQKHFYFRSLESAAGGGCSVMPVFPCLVLCVMNELQSAGFTDSVKEMISFACIFMTLRYLHICVTATEDHSGAPTAQLSAKNRKLTPHFGLTKKKQKIEKHSKGLHSKQIRGMCSEEQLSHKTVTLFVAREQCVTVFAVTV